MLEHAWQIALLLGTVVLYLLLVAQYPRAKNEEEGDPPKGLSTDQADTGEVVCPECGAINDEEYRFCRSCVTELPQSLEIEGGGSATVAREAR